jgi:hypothetical protein
MYTIVAPLPENLLTIVEPYRQKYDPLAQIVPLHIPLIDPFQFNDSLDVLYDHLNEVGELHSPIKIFLVGWDTYEGKEYQLHLPMTTGHSELTTLHYDLLGGPLSYLTGKIQDYWPRVIFGRFLQQADLDAAKDELADFSPNFVARVKHIELLHRDEMGQPWQSVKKFGLKATMAGRTRRKKSR